MEGFVVFGLLMGLLFAGITHMFTPRDIVGFSILAVFGAMEGKFLSSILIMTNQGASPLIQSGFIIWMTLFLIFLKLLLPPPGGSSSDHAS